MELKKLLKQKKVIIPITIVLLYTLLGFFLLPVVSEKMITGKLKQALNRDVSIEKIRINPFALTFEVNGFSIRDKDSAAFVSMDRFFANASIVSLFTFSGVLTQVKIENPAFNIVRYKSSDFNFTDLIPTGEAGETDDGNTGSDKGEIPRFTIQNIYFSGGSIALDDQLAGVRHKINDISFSIPEISSKTGNKEKTVESRLDLSANGSEFKIRAAGKPFDKGMASELEITTGNIDLLHYLSYVPLPGNLHIEDMDLSLAARFTFKKEKDAASLGIESTISLSNTKITGENNSRLADLPNIKVQLSTADIFSKSVHLPAVTVDSPQVEIKRDENGNINLLKYIVQPDEKQKTAETQKASGSPGAQWVLTADQFKIAGARINFEDLAQGKAFKRSASPLNLEVSKVKVAQAISGEFDVDCKTLAQEQFKTRGKFELAPLKVDGQLTISDLKVEDYKTYFEKYLHVDLARARVQLDTQYQIGQKENDLDADVAVNRFLLQAVDIRDKASKQPILDLPQLKVTGSRFNLLQRKINSGTIEIKKGKLCVSREKDGSINLIPPKKTGVDEQAPTTASGEKQSLWDVTLDQFDLSEFSLDFNDQVPHDPVNVSLSNIQVKAENLSAVKETAGNIQARMVFNSTGRISINGSAVPKKPSADLAVKLEKLDIKSVQPYFTDAIKIMITRGDINGSGRIKLDFGKDAGSMVDFNGEASVTDLVSLDKKSAKDFFKCNSFYIAGIKASLFPVVLSVRDVALTDFYSLIRISEDGSLNLSDIFKSEKAGNEKTVDAAKPSDLPQTSGKNAPQIKVTAVTLQGGHLDFSDHLAKPNFNATMKDIAGSVKGLSSKQDTKAVLHLKGLHGNSSPLEIAGFINPLAPKKYVDIGLTFKDIELSSFTPYAAKYLGYKIEKGKLILDLKYLIDGNSLSSENKIRFDNFTLGESVESEHATSLPVGLAISLLKDPNDQINLDLPVKGKLDDPEFKVGSIIAKMVGNLILKVVTSPFAIIGAFFGGGEDLGYVEFNYGDFMLDGSDTIKLDTLSKILLEKPTIKLEIQGGYHVENDLKALKTKSFENMLKAEKFKIQVEQGADVKAPEDVMVLDEERAAFIESAYENAQFIKPKDENGVEKLLDITEKEKLLITNINITEDDLRQLAIKRSETIKEYLITNSKVEKERIFILEPKKNEPKEGEKESQVTFLLK